MSIESKEILDLHSIYQNIQELSVGTITTKCKDGKKRIDCTAADKAWLEAQKGDSDNSTVKTNNITSGKGTVCKDGKNVFDGSPCGEKDSNEKVEVNPGKENGNGNGNGNETNVKVDKEVTKVKCKDGSMAVDCTTADAAWEKKQKENGNGNGNGSNDKNNKNGEENKIIDGKENKNNNGEVVTPNTNGSSDKEEVKIDKGDYLGKDKGLLNKADWLKKSSNSPAAKSGAFSDDERWAQQLKHRQWQKDNNRGAFKVEKPKSDTYTTRIGAFLNNKKVGDKKGTGKHKITQWQDLESYNPKGELLSNESYDAFDIVSSYLIESNQVENMDEALYVMMEMDAQTIQTIVKNFENILEARRADKKGIKRGEKGNPDTDQAPSGQQAADTKTGYKARRVERREGDKRRKANKERRGWNYGGKEAAAGDLANAQRQPDADLGSQKQVTDTGAHKDKHGWRQRVSSPASGRKSESASSEREDKRYPPQNPKHTLHGKKTKKDKPQGRYKEVKENYAAVEAIRLLIEKQNNASKSEPSKDTVPNKPNTPDTKNQIVLPNKGDDKSDTSKVETSSSPNKNQDRKTESPKNDGTIEAEINQIQTMPALPDKDVEKFLNPNQTGKGKKTKTNIGGRWYDTDLPAGSNELKLPKDIA